MDEDGDDEDARPLAESLLLAVADLLFCPDFTVQGHKKSGPVSPPLLLTFHYTVIHMWQAFKSGLLPPPHGPRLITPAVQLEPNTCQYLVPKTFLNITLGFFINYRLGRDDISASYTYISCTDLKKKTFNNTILEVLEVYI